MSQILGGEETVLTDNIIRTASLTAGVPDTPVDTPSQVARIQPLQHAKELTSSSSSTDSDDEPVDPSMEIHLHGHGKLSFQHFISSDFFV